jgi:hypothetical protein
MKLMCDERVFLVHSRCGNCDQVHTAKVLVPVEEGAPQDVEEFMDSAALANLAYHCLRCDSSIATLVAVTMPRSEVPA